MIRTGGAVPLEVSLEPRPQFFWHLALRSGCVTELIGSFVHGHDDAMKGCKLYHECHCVFAVSGRSCLVSSGFCQTRTLANSPEASRSVACRNCLIRPLRIQSHWQRASGVQPVFSQTGPICQKLTRGALQRDFGAAQGGESCGHEVRSGLSGAMLLV